MIFSLIDTTARMASVEVFHYPTDGEVEPRRMPDAERYKERLLFGRRRRVPRSGAGGASFRSTYRAQTAATELAAIHIATHNPIDSSIIAVNDVVRLKRAEAAGSTQSRASGSSFSRPQVIERFCSGASFLSTGPPSGQASAIASRLI
jgi:hypothetical protein